MYLRALRTASRVTVLLVVSTASAGCGATYDQASYALDSNWSLLWAAGAYHDDHGRWPDTPEELWRSRYGGAVVKPRAFENLRFRPLPNGNLEVQYDRWRTPDGTVVLMNTHWECGPCLPGPQSRPSQ